MIENQYRNIFKGYLKAVSLLTAVTFAVPFAHAQQAPRSGYSPFGSTTLQLPVIPATTPITPNGSVVEDVIARVNDQIITRSEYERALKSLLQEATQENLSQADFDEREKNMLRDMIDQQLLLSKGKELGINGDAETMRRLDEIRKQNHFDSMEALQKAVTQQGLSYEDFKQNQKNSVITQQVVRDEVGRRINMTHAGEEAYYQAHAKEFEVPEQVHLSEILIPTSEKATDADITAAQAQADAVEAKLKAGGNFADIAKTSSGGPTASAGGDLGDFKRGALGDVLENATFSLPVGAYTAPIRTRQGFVILRVDKHDAAGVPPLESVLPQVEEALYVDGLQPALRDYLTKARNDAYVDIKPGFIDSGAQQTTKKPVFTAYAPPVPKKKIVNHQKEEQKKAAIAQAQLATARAKVAEKNEEKAAAQAAKSGTKDVSGKYKKPKVHKEKIRFGQAPRNTLPDAPVETVATSGPALQGQAPGVAMAMTESTTISTGTGVDTDNPLAPAPGPTRKTRFSERQKEENTQHLEAKVVKAEEKTSARPVKATEEQTTAEKQQAAPLGLNGDTGKKKKQKTPAVMGEPKERLENQQKPVATPAAPIAPTANPALVGAPAAISTDQKAPPAKPVSSDTTALPPASATAPGAPPQGQPIPATTQVGPNQPATTPVPH